MSLSRNLLTFPLFIVFLGKTQNLFMALRTVLTPGNLRAPDGSNLGYQRKQISLILYL